ncbi:MAG: hypothetical protein FWE12_07100 [Oscillospiraceae bacterium]|nr:hypothetical protein [Oscillospiraceae bacterium]
MNEHVKTEHIDYDAIIEAIGETYGQEWFLICKCPVCSEIYLYDKEVDIIFLDPTNISVIQNRGPYSCKTCGVTFGKGSTLIESTLIEAKSSKWSWVINT